MKFLKILIFLTSFTISPTFAQSNLAQSKSTDFVDYISATNSEFDQLFEDWNVGVLHIYAVGRGTNDYKFEGKYISEKYQKFLSKELKKGIAIGTVKGNDLENNYIVSEIINDNYSKIYLCTMKNERLSKIFTLATYKNKKGKIKQRDSWLQDLNGDGMLDIIVKEKSINNKGKIIEKTAKVFYQKKSGVFKPVPKKVINTSKYFMEKQ